MSARVGRFVLVSGLGSIVIAIGLLFTGNVGRRLVPPTPPAPPGMFYIDNPYDWAESHSGRPFRLTTLILGLVLSASAFWLARSGVGKWTITFGLWNPATFVLGSILFSFTRWYRYIPAPYQFPLYPPSQLVTMFLVIWIALFLLVLAAQRSNRLRLNVRS